MKLHRGLVCPEILAQVLTAIASEAESVEGLINSEAEGVGCNFKDQATERRYAARRTAEQRVKGVNPASTQRLRLLSTHEATAAGIADASRSLIDAIGNAEERHTTVTLLSNALDEIIRLAVEQRLAESGRAKPLSVPSLRRPWPAASTGLIRRLIRR